MQHDETLVKKIVSGDMAAFKQLIAQHERLVTHMVARIIPREDDIKDVSQEVFIKVYKSIHKFKFNAKLSTWIGKIAYNTALNHAGKKSEQLRTQELSLETDIAENDTPEKILQAKDESAYLQYYISRLPLAYRTVITLYHLNEFSYQEIEEITGMPEGTVKSYLFRARKLLKERLEKFYKQNR